MFQRKKNIATARRLALAGVAVFSLIAAPSGWAWGPQTDVAVVNMATQTVANQVGAELLQLSPEITMGARLSQDRLNALFPGFAANPGSALELEMALLKKVGGKVDQYFAYRLGALGAVVANYSAPMQHAPEAYRNLYYADVDKHISGLSLSRMPDYPSEMRVFLGQLRKVAATNDSLILQDYQQGTGYQGIAAASLPTDVTRSVAAIGKVWMMVLSGKAPSTRMSSKQLEGFVLDAYAFYIQHGRIGESLAEAERLDGLTPPTAKMRVRLGDLYYGAGEKSHAIKAYEDALKKDPNRREVVEKIAQFYLAKGQENLDKEDFETALDALDAALDASPAHLEVEVLRRDTERQKRAKEERLGADMDVFERAKALWELAESESAEARYAEAIELLHQSRALFAGMSDEFPSLTNARDEGMETVATRIVELKQGILSNAKIYSGKGSSGERLNLADEMSSGIARTAYQSLIQDAYRAQLRQLEQDYAGHFSLGK
jgi:tetratricopeptide (TPR) repeat protein